MIYLPHAMIRWLKFCCCFCISLESSFLASQVLQYFPSQSSSSRQGSLKLTAGVFTASEPLEQVWLQHAEGLRRELMTKVLLCFRAL